MQGMMPMRVRRPRRYAAVERIQVRSSSYQQKARLAGSPVSAWPLATRGGGLLSDVLVLVWAGSKTPVMQGRNICAQSKSERAASSPGVVPVGPCMFCLSFLSRFSLLESRAVLAQISFWNTSPFPCALSREYCSLIPRTACAK